MGRFSSRTRSDDEYEGPAAANRQLSAFSCLRIRSEFHGTGVSIRAAIALAESFRRLTYGRRFVIGLYLEKGGVKDS